MTNGKELPVHPIGTLALIDVEKLLDGLETRFGKNEITISYTNGEPSFKFCFPDCSGLEFKEKMTHLYAVVYALIEQAYQSMGVWKKAEPEKKPLINTDPAIR